VNHKSFRFGQWRVDPATNMLHFGELSRQLEPRAMDVLLHLSRHPHTVISAEDLLDACWGDTPASDNAVHKIITQLRRALDDSASDPRYIETIRKRGYRLLAELSYDDDVSQGSWTHASPFRGLEAFEEQHAAIFFGRKLSVDRLVQVVVEQVQAACAMVLVLGPSGAGKTSLIQAGLIPALKAGAAPADAGIAITDHVQLDCADMGQSGLLETLASTLLDAEIDGQLLFQNTSATALAQYMAQDLPGLVAHLQAQLPTLRLAVFIDRFEAVFRLPHITEAERIVFINVLEQLARSGCMLLILACRNDFYPHLTAYPALMNMKLRGGHFDLTPPGSADIAQIVRHPAQVAQLRYTVDEHGETLDDLLCHAAKAGPDTLPLLQYCLQELYRQRTPAGELTHVAFHQMGGLEGAIGARAEQVISALGPAQIAALPQLLSRLVLVAEDEATVTARRVPWSDVSNGDETKLVQGLVDAHLFVSDLHCGAPAFGIAHEALLRRWPRVVAWVEEHRQALQTRSRISAQARRWQDSGRKRDMLLPSGTQANQARELVKTAMFSFTAEERSFIDLSLNGARRAERLRIGIMVMITSLALLAAVLGLKARSAQVEAEAHRTEAEGLMGFMLGEFVEKLRPLGKLDLLDSVSTRAFNYLSSPGRANDGGDAIQRAKSLQIIAEVRLARADPTAAASAMLAARAIIKDQFNAGKVDTALLKIAGENSFWLGQLYFDKRDWTNATRYFEEYRDYANKRAELDPSNMDSWIEQSYAHNSLGSVALREGNAHRAAAEFSVSVDLKTKASKYSPQNNQLIADLADSLSWQAQAQTQLGNLSSAEKLYSRQLELLQKLNNADPGATVWVKELAAAWARNSELKQAMGKVPDAHNDAKLAYSLYVKAVALDPTNRVWQRLLAISELRLYDSMQKRPDPAIELAQFGLLQEKFDTLISAAPNNKSLKITSVIISQRKMEAMLRQHDFSAANTELQVAESKLIDLKVNTSSDPEMRNAWVETLLLSADIRQSKVAESQEPCKVARAALAPLVNNSMDFKILAMWVKANTCMNRSEDAKLEKEKLAAMNYLHPNYLEYLSNHPLKKAKP
jgi:DNA-binding winged helix-turn-helix (wHTH) protein/tetratricopeptide (TPR) repeat protein